MFIHLYMYLHIYICIYPSINIGVNPVLDRFSRIPVAQPQKYE